MPLQPVEEGTNLGAGPILGAYEFAADDPLAVDDVGLRPHVGVVELGRGFVRIADVDEIHMMPAEKAGVCVGILVDADGKHSQAGLIVVKLKKRWQLDDAGLAPGGPEVEQDHPATIAGEVNAVGAV